MICPICKKMLPMAPGEHEQMVFERHEAAGECIPDNDVADTERAMVEHARKESLKTLSKANAISVAAPPPASSSSVGPPATQLRPPSPKRRRVDPPASAADNSGVSPTMPRVASVSRLNLGGGGEMLEPSVALDLSDEAEARKAQELSALAEALDLEAPGYRNDGTRAWRRKNRERWQNIDDMTIRREERHRKRRKN